MAAQTIHQEKALVLSKTEYNTLYTTGTLTKDGVTYTYSPNVEYRVKGHYLDSDEITTILNGYVTGTYADNTYQTKTGRTGIDLSSGTSENPISLSNTTIIPLGIHDVVNGGYICASNYQSGDLTIMEIPTGSILSTDGEYTTLIINGYFYFVDNEGIRVTNWASGGVLFPYSYMEVTFLSKSDAQTNYQPLLGWTALDLTGNTTSSNPRSLSTITTATGTGFYYVTVGGYVCADNWQSGDNTYLYLSEGDIVNIGNIYTTVIQNDGISFVDNAGILITDWQCSDKLALSYGILSTIFLSQSTAQQTYQPLPSSITLSDNTTTLDTFTDNTYDGSTTTDVVFELPNTPVASVTSVTVGGTLLTVTTDYTVNGNEVTILDMSSYSAGVTVEIVYSYYSTTTLANNTEYYSPSGGLSTLVFDYPQGNFECYMSLTFASSGTITVIFPESSYIGDAPTFANDETWEISIKNGVIVAGKVESANE